MIENFRFEYGTFCLHKVVTLKFKKKSFCPVSVCCWCMLPVAGGRAAGPAEEA